MRIVGGVEVVRADGGLRREWRGVGVVRGWSGEGWE